MGQKLIRIALSIAVLGIALASIDPDTKTYGKGEQIELESFAWGVGGSQLMRICFGNAVGASQPRPHAIEEVAFTFVAIKFESGVTAHETELQVPVGQYRCTDLTYQSLVAAGLSPQSNSALQFFVNIRTRSSASSVGATEAITVGAAQNIDIVTGEIKLIHPFRVVQTR